MNTSNYFQGTFSGKLGPSQLAFYRANGFLALRGFLSFWEVYQAKRAISRVIRRQVELPARADLVPPPETAPTHAGYRFKSIHDEFYLELEQGWDSQKRSGAEVEPWVSKLMNYHNEHPLFRRFSLENQSLLHVLSQLLEDRAALYQSVAFIKPARIGSKKDWHQDNAYFHTGDPNKVTGIWIALDRATRANGCMHVLPGAHRGGPLLHEFNTDCEIAQGRIDSQKAVAIELDPGDILFFHGNLPHMTPPNDSPKRRRALQFHFRGAENKLISYEAYQSVFAERDGTPATCAAAHARRI